MLVYDTLEQARMRLRGSILTFEDKAVLVREVREATKTKPMLVDVSVYPLIGDTGHEITDAKKLSIPIGDPALNFRIFHVGYINDPYRLTADFMVRNTARQQIQGLQTRALFSASGNRVSNQALNGQALEDMLLQKYPTPKEAFDMIHNKGWISVGVSSQFAVGRDMKIKSLFKLFYRGTPVGLAIGKNFENFTLDDEYLYLKEVLAEEGIPFICEAA